MGPDRAFRLLVVAENPLARSGLTALLARAPELSVAAERDSLDASSLEPEADLVVWELGSSDAEALSRASDVARASDTLFLVSDESSVRALVAGGARGVLFRDADAERLRRACLAVLAGASVLDEGMLERLIEPERREPPSTGELTQRELEVLALMAEGLSNKLIAARLGISDHTAKFHVNAVLDKLSAETRTEAVVTAARRGLLML